LAETVEEILDGAAHVPVEPVPGIREIRHELHVSVAAGIRNDDIPAPDCTANAFATTQSYDSITVALPE
jgi:hypothetical protein